jgi:hypothetical protein
VTKENWAGEGEEVTVTAGLKIGERAISKARNGRGLKKLGNARKWNCLLESPQGIQLLILTQ